MKYIYEYETPDGLIRNFLYKTECQNQIENDFDVISILAEKHDLLEDEITILDCFNEK